MQLIHGPDEVRAWSRAARARGQRVGFVPTMGFLHEGHLSLMRIAGERAERTVVSIFVNPTQFGPGEDLDRYPRDTDGDLAACREVGVDAVYLPPVEAMYPPGSQTWVEVEGLTGCLCGRNRPTHFRGVTTVVSILFHQVEPDLAVFGEKDYQQLQVIRRMTRDLQMPVEIVPGPIVREPDGVAMSSRNANLSADERAQAVVLNRSLRWVGDRVADGARDIAELIAGVRSRVDAQPLASVDYVEVVDAETLAPVSGELSAPARMALAVQFPSARLIDNWPLEPGGSAR
jgi:pantoate--beta-alanine ligase